MIRMRTAWLLTTMLVFVLLAAKCGTGHTRHYCPTTGGDGHNRGCRASQWQRGDIAHDLV